MDQRTLPRDLAIARAAVAVLREAGITEEDPDFAELLENEADALETLRHMLRRARLDEADAEATKSIETQLKDRRARLLARAESLRHAVMNAMSELALTKLPAPDMTVSLRTGKPSVDVTDLSKLPERYVRVKVEADKAAIRAALDDGEDIPGVTLGNASPVLTVRTR